VCFVRAHDLLYTAGNAVGSIPQLPQLEHNFALSQTIRCAPRAKLSPKKTTSKGESHKVARSAIWQDCDNTKKDPSQLVLLGYAMRTPEYRYISYFLFNHSTQMPDLIGDPYEEELYDHKNETLHDFTHRETFNLAVRPAYSQTILNLRLKLVEFIKTKISFGDH
jgi:hypothetical protein